MNLVAISPNVLINPEFISCIEQKVHKGVDVTYICIGDKEYILQVPMDDFYRSLGIVEMNSGEQHFAG